jgi:pimeloyl-ACP methyl ester carboxylesterase
VQRLSPHGRESEAAILFIHGLIIDNLSSFYYTLAGPVADAGFDAYMYDLRGHGRSERPPTGYGIEDSLADLEAVLDGFGLDQKVFLAGNSWGGYLAIQFTLMHPDRVAGLILIDSYAGEDPNFIEGFVNSLTVGAIGLEHSRGHSDLPPPRDQRKRGLMAMRADALLNETSLIDDLALAEPMGPAELKLLDCRVLGLYGEYSVQIKAADVLRRYVSDLTLKVIPDSDHTILRDAIPELRELIVGWLRECLRATSADRR